jgi:hypothetical protein
MRSVLLKVFVNNIKVLLVFGIQGFLIVVALLLAMLNWEINISGLIFWGVVFFGAFGLHFLSGKHFLRKTGNLFTDGASFILIVILAVICVVYIQNFPANPFNAFNSPGLFFETLLNMLFSPALIVGGFMEAFIGTEYERISIGITVSFSIFMQFRGMVKNVKT